MLSCWQALRRSGSAVRELAQSWRHAQADEHLLLEATPCWQALHQQALSMVVGLAPVSQLTQQVVTGLHLWRSWFLVVLQPRQQELTGQLPRLGAAAVLHAVHWARAQLQQPKC